jgi:hypothetical protein
LESLQIAEINFSKLFAGHPENNGGISQPSSSMPLAQIESKCSFMPSTLKYVFIWDIARVEDDENPDDLVIIFLSLLAKCPQLCFMPICINTGFDLFELIGERNPRESEKLIRYYLIKTRNCRWISMGVGGGNLQFEVPYFADCNSRSSLPNSVHFQIFKGQNFAISKPFT